VQHFSDCSQGGPPLLWHFHDIDLDNASLTDSGSRG
jgi:hypothetical protein